MSARLPWSVVFRAFAIQGSWNYETLAGTGFAFAILPALRRIYPDERALDAAVKRHEAMFNSHPYLAPLALGAVIRMEEQGEDPEVIDRFKAALRGSLGTFGDQLVWTGWRPLCMLLALSSLLVGVPWWLAVLLFLVLYNVGHVGLMLWGFSIGLQEGRAVAERIRSSHVRQALPRMMEAGSFIAGVTLALALVRGLPMVQTTPAIGWLALAAIGAAAGAWWGERARGVAAAAVAAVVVAGVAAGVLT